MKRGVVMLKHVIFLVILFVGAYLFMTERTIEHGPGVVAPTEPTQSPAFGIKSFTDGNYEYEPLAEFEIKARVLSKKWYSTGKLADISSYDFFLGWGSMSDERVLDELLITQSDRYFQWEMTHQPIPYHEMVKQTANIHLIPSTPELEEQFGSVLKGHIVRLKGVLVKVSSPDGWQMKSSLKRDDFGEDASELLWVKEFEIL